MGLFDIFRKKSELTEEQKKWNKIWALWEQGEALSPYSELMTYQSEVNNGGHDQYFTNIHNDLQNDMPALMSVLHANLSENLQTAYRAYSALEKNDEYDGAEAVLERCDEAFFENEEDINKILEEYAARTVI